MRTIMMAAAAAAMLATSAPAEAQGLLGSLRDLRSQVEAMTKPKRDRAPANQAATATATDGDTSPTTSPDGEAMFSMASMDDASDTNLASTPTRAGDVSSYELLGFRLGMSPREVARVADKRRIRRVMDANVTGDFELEATRIANTTLSRQTSDRSKRQISIAYGRTPDGGRVQLEFTLERTGPELSTVLYNTKPQGQTREQVRQALIARYGKPDSDLGQQMKWCGGKESRRCMGDGDDPWLQVHIDDTQVMFTLHRGYAYLRRREADMKARAAEIAGRAGKPMSF